MVCVKRNRAPRKNIDTGPRFGHCSLFSSKVVTIQSCCQGNTKCSLSANQSRCGPRSCELQVYRHFPVNSYHSSWSLLEILQSCFWMSVWSGLASVDPKLAVSTISQQLRSCSGLISFPRLREILLKAISTASGPDNFRIAAQSPRYGSTSWHSATATG